MVKRKLAALNREILGDSDHIFDQMLADVIRATWLEMHYLMSVDADATNRTAGLGIESEITPAPFISPL